MATTVCMCFSKFQVRPLQLHTKQNPKVLYTVQKNHIRVATSRQDLVEAVAQWQHLNNLVRSLAAQLKQTQFQVLRHRTGVRA